MSFLALGVSAQGFIYHHPESQFLDTNLWEGFRNCRLATSTYTFGGQVTVDTLVDISRPNERLKLLDFGDSIHILVLHELRVSDYLKINFYKDSIKFYMPLSKMIFTNNHNSACRTKNATLYSIFNESEFTSYLDYDTIVASANRHRTLKSNRIIYSNQGKVIVKKYLVRKNILSKHRDIIKSHCGLNGLSDYKVVRVNVENSFIDELDNVYYLYNDDRIMLKFQFWNYGGLRITSFEY